MNVELGVILAVVSAGIVYYVYRDALWSGIAFGVVLVGSIIWVSVQGTPPPPPPPPPTGGLTPPSQVAWTLN